MSVSAVSLSPGTSKKRRGLHDSVLLLIAWEVGPVRKVGGRGGRAREKEAFFFSCPGLSLALGGGMGFLSFVLSCQQSHLSELEF